MFVRTHARASFVRAWSRGATAALSLLLVACGARTGLDEPSGRDARPGRDAGPPAAVDAELCDGLDQDGDGRVDEALPPLRCPGCVGDVASCVDGAPGACPPLGAVLLEVCNAVDDDCDGRIDEDLGFGPIGDAVVLRDVDEGSAGDCERCGHVIRADLVTLGARLQAIWHYDYTGYTTEPTSFVRPLDDRGRPLDGPRPLLDFPTTRLQLAPSGPGRTTAAMCERREDRLDYPRSVFLDDEARVVGDVQPREPADERCNSAPEVLWTGAGHYFARVTVNELRLEAASASGESLATTSRSAPDLAASVYRRDLGPFVATFEDDLLLSEPDASDRWDAPFRVHRFDDRLTLVATYEVPRLDADSDGYHPLAILRSARGLLTFAGRRTPPTPGRAARDVWSLAELSLPSGELRAAGEVDLRDSTFLLGGTPPFGSFVRRGADDIVGIWGSADSGGVAGIVRFTERGEELGRWTVPSVDSVTNHAAHTHAGRVLVIYLRELGRFRNRVELIELGCTP